MGLFYVGLKDLKVSSPSTKITEFSNILCEKHSGISDIGIEFWVEIRKDTTRWSLAPVPFCKIESSALTNAKSKFGISSNITQFNWIQILWMEYFMFAEIE